MNVMRYVGKFDEEAWQLFCSIGLSPTRLRNEKIGMAAVEQGLEYKRELFAGDLLTIRPWIEEMREKSLVLVHEMINQEAEERAARTVITRVCMDLTTRKARPLPSDIREHLVSARTARGEVERTV